MTRYLLDTNVISEFAKAAPSERVLEWLSDKPDHDLFISAITLAELKRGVLEMPEGKRRKAVEQWFEGPSGPIAIFHARILPFDDVAALIWSRLMAEGKRGGKPREALDMMIAAIAEANGCIVATLNAKDFEGVAMVNPAAHP